MGLRNALDRGHCVGDEPLVDKMIGSAYAHVRVVAVNIEFVKHVSLYLQEVFLVAGDLDKVRLIADRLDEIELIAANIEALATLVPRAEAATTALQAALAPAQALVAIIPQIVALAGDLPAIVSLESHLGELVDLHGSLSQVLELHEALPDLLTGKLSAEELTERFTSLEMALVNAKGRISALEVTSAMHSLALQDDAGDILDLQTRMTAVEDRPVGNEGPVTNDDLAPMDPGTIKGSASGGQPQDLGALAIKAILAIAVEDVAGLFARLDEKLDATSLDNHAGVVFAALAQRVRYTDVGVSVAPLVDGYVPIGNIPSLALVDAYELNSVDDELTGPATDAVNGKPAAERGDIAIRYDVDHLDDERIGTYLLAGNGDRTVLANWKKLRNPLSTSSVGDIQGITGIGLALITAANQLAVQTLVGLGYEDGDGNRWFLRDTDVESSGISLSQRLLFLENRDQAIDDRVSYEAGRNDAQDTALTGYGNRITTLEARPAAAPAPPTSSIRGTRGLTAATTLAQLYLPDTAYLVSDGAKFVNVALAANQTIQNLVDGINNGAAAAGATIQAALDSEGRLLVWNTAGGVIVFAGPNAVSAYALLGVPGGRSPVTVTSLLSEVDFRRCLNLSLDLASMTVRPVVLRPPTGQINLAAAIDLRGVRAPNLYIVGQAPLPFNMTSWSTNSNYGGTTGYMGKGTLQNLGITAITTVPAGVAANDYLLVDVQKTSTAPGATSSTPCAAYGGCHKLSGAVTGNNGSISYQATGYGGASPGCSLSFHTIRIWKMPSVLFFSGTQPSGILLGNTILGGIGNLVLAATPGQAQTNQTSPVNDAGLASGIVCRGDTRVTLGMLGFHGWADYGVTVDGACIAAGLWPTGIAGGEYSGLAFSYCQQGVHGNISGSFDARAVSFTAFHACNQYSVESFGKCEISLDGYTMNHGGSPLRATLAGRVNAHRIRAEYQSNMQSGTQTLIVGYGGLIDGYQSESGVTANITVNSAPVFSGQILI